VDRSIWTQGTYEDGYEVMRGDRRIALCRRWDDAQDIARALTLDHDRLVAYEEGAENEWATIAAIADEHGDETLLQYVKDGLTSRGWTP
jgi:hypothetical protein